jgi:phage tail-like protein
MLIEKQLHTMLTAAFRFIVLVDHHPLGAFTECSLPTIEWEVQPIKEGGQNVYVHQLIGPRKEAKLSLKNGVAIATDLFLWYQGAMNEKISRRDVTITLLSPMMVPIMVWHIENAVPIRWTMPQLQTDSNAIAVQTLELACGEITIE